MANLTLKFIEVKGSDEHGKTHKFQLPDRNKIIGYVYCRLELDAPEADLTLDTREYELATNEEGFRWVRRKA